VNLAHVVQRPTRLAAPVAWCNEAVAITKDALVATGGAWSLLTRMFSETNAWSGARVWGVAGIVQMASSAHRSLIDPTERAYAAASSDYVRDARRVIDVLRSAANDDADRFTDPLASGWDDVVRRPSLLAPATPVTPLPSAPFGDEPEYPASSA
jgi:hypothetical protein